MIFPCKYNIYIYIYAYLEREGSYPCTAVNKHRIGQLRMVDWCKRLHIASYLRFHCRLRSPKGTDYNTTMHEVVVSPFVLWRPPEVLFLACRRMSAQPLGYNWNGFSPIGWGWIKQQAQHTSINCHWYSPNHTSYHHAEMYTVIVMETHLPWEKWCLVQTCGIPTIYGILHSCHPTTTS